MAMPYGYAYAMGMPLHSHRDIHIIMPLMVIVIGRSTSRSRLGLGLGLEKRVLPGRSRVRFARTLILPFVECFADDDVPHTLHVGLAFCSSAIARVLAEYV